MRDIDEVEFGQICWAARSPWLKIARFTPWGKGSDIAMGRSSWRAGMFSLEDMLTRFGGGDYYIRVFDGSRYVQTFSVSLDYTVPARDP